MDIFFKKIIKYVFVSVTFLLSMFEFYISMAGIYFINECKNVPACNKLIIFYEIISLFSMIMSFISLYKLTQVTSTYIVYIHTQLNNMYTICAIQHITLLAIILSYYIIIGKDDNINNENCNDYIIVQSSELAFFLVPYHILFWISVVVIGMSFAILNIYGFHKCYDFLCNHITNQNNIQNNI